jgi:hypothetical protein
VFTVLGTTPQSIGRVVLDERIGRAGRVILIDRFSSGVVPSDGRGELSDIPLDQIPVGPPDLPSGGPNDDPLVVEPTGPVPVTDPIVAP